MNELRLEYLNKCMAEYSLIHDNFYLKIYKLELDDLGKLGYELKNKYIL